MYPTTRSNHNSEDPAIQNEEKEKTAVQRCLEQLWSTYKNGNAKAIADLYHPNANLVIQGQEVAIGRQAIEREYTKVLAMDPAQPDTRINQSLRIHLVRPDLAVVDAAATLTRAGAGEDEEKIGEAFFTIVVIKEAEQWLLAAVRGANGDNISAP